MIKDRSKRITGRIIAIRGSVCEIEFGYDEKVAFNSNLHLPKVISKF